MRSATSTLATALGWAILAIGGLTLGDSRGYGQAQEPPKYTAEEYKAYQAATTETDPAKKTTLLVAFLKERPQSTLQQHIIASYQTMMNELQSAQNWTQMVSSGEAFLVAVPDDIFTVSMLATAYQKTNDLKKFVEYGEKVFDKNPTGNTAYYLTKAYKDLKNDAKFLQWGEKTVELLPDNHEILIDITKKFAELKKNAPSAKYARQTIKVLQAAQKPEAATEKDWKTYVGNSLASCYAIVGNVAYDGQDYRTAISNLESSLRYYGRNELAYYYLAQAYWQQGQIDMAMKNFAKCYLLKGSTSKAAKQHLDNLYKSTHQNSLVGQERVIAKAQSELP